MADNVSLKDGTGAAFVSSTTEKADGSHSQLVGLDIGAGTTRTRFIDPATGAKQDTANTALASILAALSDDPATQTTLAAILAKIIAAPSTEAKQDAAIAALGTLVTQTDGVETTLGSILSKLIAAPATEAKQDTANTALAALVAGLAATQAVSAASLPLPSGAATETKQDDAAALLTTIDADIGTLVARAAPLQASIPPDTTPATPVRQVPADLTRCSFSDVGAGLLTTEMTTVATGAGQVVSQSGGNLLITTGTTANAETLLRSVRTFRGAHMVRYKFTLSQRIANNTFEVELADLIGTALAYTINSATSVTVTFPATNPFTSLNVGQSMNLGALSSVGIPGRWAIASVAGLTVTFTVAAWPATGSGTLTLWGWNFHRVVYDGTAATTAQYDAARRGWASGNTAVTTSTTAGAGHVGHFQSIGQSAGFADSLSASNAGFQWTARASRIENLPDDTTDLHLFIVARNGATAPASTTTLTVGFWSVELTGRDKVYLAGGDQMGAPMAPLVNATINGAIPAGGNNIGSVSLIVGSQAVGTVGATAPATPFILNSAATTNGALILTGTSGLHAFYATNTGATAAYVKLYNKATAPAVGTDVPVMILTVPAAVSGVPGVATLPIGFAGFRFALGLGIAITGAAADADTTAIAAGQVKVILSRTV